MSEAAAVIRLKSWDVGALLADESKITFAAQPIVDLDRARVVGFEALARFQLEPYAPPDLVFAEAVRLGCAEQLEALVVKKALELKSDLPPHYFLTINLDPIHAGSSAVWRSFDTLSNLAGIVIELTEHRIVENFRDLSKAIEEFRRRGALIAVDDAGLGYSGLKQILELRPQLLKLDRELISNVHQDEAKRALVQMMGEFTARLDGWVLAEGIETAEELSALRKLGVPLGQGYFLGRPAPPWSDLSEVGAQVLAHELAQIGRPGTVGGLIEPLSSRTEDEAYPEKRLACVRVDHEGRPIGARWWYADVEVQRGSHELLRVKASTSLRDVAQRAMTRLEPLRWDPLVCVDDEGQLIGQIKMQRLLMALAEGQAVEREPLSR